jgi:hypothetical protein
MAISFFIGLISPAQRPFRALRRTPARAAHTCPIGNVDASGAKLIMVAGGQPKVYVCK